MGLYNCIGRKDMNVKIFSFGLFFSLPKGSICCMLFCLVSSFRNNPFVKIRPVHIGSFSNNDGDANENVKTAIGLLSKTTSLHVHHAFLYISWPLLHDYDVKMPNSRFMEDVNKRRRNFLSKLECGPQEINSREICLH